MVIKRYEVEDDTKLLGILLWGLNFFFPFIASIVIWVIKREESDFIEDQGKLFLNFLISSAIYSLVSVILMIVLVGFILLPIVGVWAFIINIIGLVNAVNCEVKPLPFVIDFLGAHK